MAQTGSSSDLQAKRPLSPHLQVFRPLITMVMSIVHRITGVALYAGSLLVAWWLIAAASGPDYFDTVQGLWGSWFGRLVLFGYTWALLHHMLGGIRHFVWDAGLGYEAPMLNRLAWATLIGSVALTILMWVAGFMAG